MAQANRVGNIRSVKLAGDDIVEVTLSGKYTAADVTALHRAIQEAIDGLHSQGKLALVLVDITRLDVGDFDAQARASSRQLLQIDADGAAIIGKSAMASFVLYTLRLTHPRAQVRYFTSRARARKWILDRKHPQKARSGVGLVAALIIGLIGFTALIGWLHGDRHLMGWIAVARPINPVAAVGLLVVAWGYFAYWRGAVRQVRISGTIVVVLGVLALLPWHIDTLLFGAKVSQFGHGAFIADSAALCFIAAGIVELVARRTKKWVLPVEAVGIVVIVTLSLANLYAQLYARDWLMTLSGAHTYAMALNLAVAFLVAAVSAVLLVFYKQKRDILGQVNRTGWLIMVVLVCIQVATYGAWSQAIDHNTVASNTAFSGRANDMQESLNARLQVYEDALRGFRGLFNASDNVAQADFQHYFESLNLLRNYPGFRSIAYIAAVPDEQVTAFVQQYRQDKSLNPAGNPGFTIVHKTNAPVHYVATYVASSTPQTSGLGLDLTSVPGREKIYGDAVASGELYSSGTVTFLKTSTQPQQQGFFLTMPVKSATSDKYIGLVNANFNYADFFPALFAQQGLLKDVNIAVIDGSKKIYEADNAPGAVKNSRTLPVVLGNHSWKLRIGANKNFAIESSQLNLPKGIFAVGQLLTLLVGVIFIMQNRSRKQAIALAEQVTQDLRHERNHVVELHKKDEAILGGIGEGLLALDANGKIERVNMAAQKLLGLSEADMVGNHLVDIVEATDMELKPLSIEHRPSYAALTKRRTVTTKVYYRRKDGHMFPVELNVAPVILNDKLIGAIEVFRDITHDYELDKAKSEFVSLASHQLRTPLSAVNWYAEMLLTGDAGKLNKEQMSFIREIFEGNQRMVELVNALLDVSRLDLGRMINHAEPTDMASLVTALEKELAASIMTKKMQVEKDIDTDLALVNGDPKLLRIIVQNLFSNAVKYTPDGGTVGIVLRAAKATDMAHLKRAGSPRNYVYLEVRDSGYGIPMAQQKHIFEKLFRADNVRKLDVEGTGLGLYLVKQVSESLGGTVWFGSEENQGTRFSVLIPYKTHGAVTKTEQ
jgi:PAS domain S-box-containing protein